MLKTVTLALTVSLLLSAQATAQEKKQPPTAPPQPNAILCKAEAQSLAPEIAPLHGASLQRGA